LARGDTPSLEHPTGGHYFLALDTYYELLDEDIDGIFDTAFGK